MAFPWINLRKTDTPGSTCHSIVHSNINSCNCVQRTPGFGTNARSRQKYQALFPLSYPAIRV